MKIYLHLFILISTICLDKINAQRQNCVIADAFVSPGQYSINEQSINGFCKEWVVGNVVSPRKFLITFVDNEVRCNENDQLIIYGEHRNIVFNYCEVENDVTLKYYVFFQERFIYLRLTSPTSRGILVTFNFINFDSPTTFQPQTNPIAPFFEKNLGECPTTPKRMLDEEGLIEYHPLNSKIKCFWLIEAQFNEKVQLDFEYINLPARINPFGICENDFLSISSYNRPLQDYKLCGQRRSVKFIVTYNAVLITLQLGANLEENNGFKMKYKLIKDPLITTPQPSIAVTTSPFLSPSLNCGVSFTKFEARIVGGVESVPHSFPWQVLLTDGFVMCGAALIDDDWIITAAHCVQGVPIKMLKAYLGMHNRRIPEQTRVTKYISKIIVHPDYIGRMNQWDNDIAILKLQEPVKYSIEIGPVCLPPSGYNFATVGKTGIVTGWGETLGTGSSYVLRQTTITVANTRDCGAQSDNMICAGQMYPELHDSCQGDSGGPFVIKHNKNYFLVGIVSWGYDCNGAGIYTKVSNYIDWIDKVTHSY